MLIAFPLDFYANLAADICTSLTHIDLVTLDISSGHTTPGSYSMNIRFTG